MTKLTGPFRSYANVRQRGCGLFYVSDLGVWLDRLRKTTVTVDCRWSAVDSKTPPPQTQSSASNCLTVPLQPLPGLIPNGSLLRLNSET